MQAHDLLATLPFGLYPFLIFHLILASMEAIPTSFLIFIVTLMLVTVVIPRAISISDINERLNSLLRMSTILNHLPAKIADLKKGQDALSLQLHLVATTLNDMKNKAVPTSPPDTHHDTLIAIQSRIDELCARPAIPLPTPPSPPSLLDISDIQSRNTPPSLPVTWLRVSKFSELVTQETTPRESPASLLGFSSVAKQATATALPLSPILSLSAIATQQTVPVASKSATIALSQVNTVATAPREVARQTLELGGVRSQTTEPMAPQIKKLSIGGVSQQSTMPEAAQPVKLVVGSVKSQTTKPMAPKSKDEVPEPIEHESIISITENVDIVPIGETTGPAGADLGSITVSSQFPVEAITKTWFNFEASPKVTVEASTASVMSDGDVDDEEFDAFAEDVLATEGFPNHYYQEYPASFEAEVEEKEHRMATTSREIHLRASAASFAPGSISAISDVTSNLSFQQFASTSATRGGLGGSRYASRASMTTSGKEDPRIEQQPQTFANKEMSRAMVPKSQVHPSPAPSTTQGGLGFSRHASSSLLPTYGEQATKNQQQLQTTKKEETLQDVLLTSDAGEIKTQATEPRMSLSPLTTGTIMAVASSSFEVTSPSRTGLSSDVASSPSPSSSNIALENASTPSALAKRASGAAGPVSERFCSVCDKTVASNIWTQHERDHHGFCKHCHKEVSGDWSDNKFWYDDHKKPCYLQLWRSENPSPTSGTKAAASPKLASTPHRSLRKSPRPLMPLYGKKISGRDQPTPPSSSRGTGRPPMPTCSKQAPKAKESPANEAWAGNVIKY